MVLASASTAAAHAASTARMEGTAAGTTAAPAKGAAAAHAAEAASTGRPRPAAGRAGSAGAPVIVGATAASAAKPIPQPETEQPAKARTGPAAAKGGENIDHRRNDDKIGDDRDPCLLYTSDAADDRFLV